MSQFDDNTQAIEELTASIALTADELSNESARALSSEAYYSAQFNPNPMYWVEELIPPSGLSDSLLGTAFLLLSSHGLYANGHTYLVVKGDEPISLTYEDITDY